jgi:hypothetical protein
VGSRDCAFLRREKSLDHDGTKPLTYKNCFGIVGYGCECTAISKLYVENGAGSLIEIKKLSYFAMKFATILLNSHKYSSSLNPTETSARVFTLRTVMQKI